MWLRIKHKAKILCLIVCLLLALTFSSTSWGYDSRRSKPPFVTPPPPDGLTIAQQNSWNELQRYNAWLYSRPDFDDFNRVYIESLSKYGLTAQQVNADLYNEAMSNGGDFSIIRRRIDSWYNVYRKYGDINDLDFLLYFSSVKNKVDASKANVSSKQSSLHASQHKTSSSQPMGVNIGAGNIVMFSLLIGVTVSTLAVFICKGLISDTGSHTNTDSPTESYSNARTSSERQEADYIDVEFTERLSDNDFDYPYEDIGDVANS